MELTDRKVCFWGFITVLAAVLALYTLTLAPDLVWQDQGDYQYQTALLNLNRPGDVVRVHPLFIATAHYLARITPWSYAYSANFVSAVFSAIAAANVFVLVYLLGRRIWPGVLASAVLVFGHTFWFVGVQAQSYSMSNAAFTAALALLAAYIIKPRQLWLYLMGLAFGLGISAHMMSQIAFAIIFIWLAVLWLKKQFAFAGLLKIAAGWVVGAALLWFVMWLEYQRSGDLAATVASAIWGQWGSAVFNLGRWYVLIAKSVLFFVLNFPTPLVLLAVPGIWYSFKRLEKPMPAMLAVMTLIYGLFAARYDVRNQNHFFMPMYILVAVYIGLGFGFMFGRQNKAAVAVSAVLLLMMVPMYPLMAHVAARHEVEFGTRRHIPYRDVYSYYLMPWQHDQTGARRFAREVFQTVPENSIIVADSTTIPALQYMHYIEGVRADVSIYSFAEFDAEYEDYNDIDAGMRMFTISSVKGYYPPWVESPEWLEPFEISQKEKIYEIIRP